MSLIEKYRHLFDPAHRDSVRAAKRAAEEIQARESVQARLADLESFMNTQAYRHLRLSLESSRAACRPSSSMDAAGAYWKRDGIEEAIRILDAMSADLEVNDAG